MPSPFRLFPVRAAKQRKTQRFRTHLIEMLEPKVLLAADAANMVQDLTNRSLQQGPAIIGPSRATIDMDLSSLFDKSGDVITPEMYYHLRSGFRLREVSNQPGELAQYLGRQHENAGRLQSELMSSPFAPTIDLNSNRPRSITETSLTPSNDQSSRLLEGTPQSLSVLAKLRSGMPKRESNTADRGTSLVSALPTMQPVQWVGAYCTAEGEIVFPEDDFSGMEMFLLLGEGEGSEEEEDWLISVIPQVELPPLEFVDYTGQLNSFIPSQQTNISQITTYGSFTPSSLTNPNFSLPGLHWAKQVEQTWVSSTEWSLTETFVMSFRLSDTKDTSDSRSVPMAVMLAELQEEEPPEEYEQSLELDFESETDASATRIGYYTLVFHASRGVSTPAAAGVKWSFTEGYADAIDLEVDDVRVVDYSPEEYDPNFHIGDEVYPSDYQGQMSTVSNAMLGISASGTNVFSSTPSINSSSEIERAVTASVIYNNSGNLSSTNSWSDASQSGTITFPNQTGTPLQHLASVKDATLPLSSLPEEVEDIQEEYSLDVEDEDYEPGGYVDELGETAGSGTLSVAGGSSSGSAGGSIGGAVSLSGVLTDGEFSSLVGNAMNALQAAKEASGGAAGVFTVRDEEIVSTPYGPETSSIVLVAGWKGQDAKSGDGDAALDVGVELDDPESEHEHDFDDTPGGNDTEVNGDSKGGGKDFLDVVMRRELDDGGYSGTFTGYFGTHEASGTRDYWKTVKFSSELAGTTIGDLEGIINLDGIGAEGNSILKGYSREVLEINASEEWESNELAPSVPLAVFEGEGGWDHSEKVVSTWSIDGTLNVSRVEDGPLEVALNAEVLTKLEVEYSDYVYEDQVTRYDTNPGNDNRYDWSRSATLNGTRTTSSTISGTASIDPHLAANDSGGFTTTSSNVYSGDSITEIVTDGNYWGVQEDLESQSPREIELEVLLGIYVPPENEENGYGGYGGGEDPPPPPPPPPSNPPSMFWGVTTAFFKGMAQGAVNIANGVQDAAIGMANIPIAGANLIADGIDYAVGTPEHQRIRVPTIPSPDWSRNLIIEEGGTPGGWDDMHGWSKAIGGEGVMMLVGAGVGRAASAVDEAGNCANWIARFIKGGCFVAGTQVLISELPYSSSRENAVWSEWDWERDGQDEWELEAEMPRFAVANRNYYQVPIEEVPLGARVPTKNPRPWEYDDSLPAPEQEHWAKLTITMYRNDGGIVNAEFLRPKKWIQSNELIAGRSLPINFPELQVQGVAIVTSIGECPPIASGEGSVVTARFLTQEVHEIARVEVEGPDGAIDILEGTPIHPIWSEDRQDWVPLGELEEGESLRSGLGGEYTVRSVNLSRQATAVFNLEVNGEHVYELSRFCILAHNECLRGAMLKEAGAEASEYTGWFAAHIFPESGFKWAPKLADLRAKMIDWDLLNNPANGFWTDSRRHLGTHTKEYVDALVKEFSKVKNREGAIQALDNMYQRIKAYEWGAH